jgi:hypothetical protein
MVNKTTIMRTEKNSENPYLKVSAIITKLPFLEAALMFQILSNSDGWIINKNLLEKQSGIGRRKFGTIWNNLVKKGHIIQKRNTAGYNKTQKIICWEYTIYEKPSNVE